jgi:hypothetical protein
MFIPLPAHHVTSDKRGRFSAKHPNREIESSSPANHERYRQEEKRCQRDSNIDREQEAGFLIDRHLADTNALNFLGIFMLAFGEGIAHK